MKLDRYDIAILNVLQKEGRISKRDLADRIGLSVSPCWVRMRKLEDLGYIIGYHANIEFDRIARFCHVTTLVRLESHHADAFRRFETVVTNTPQIVHCQAVIGETDYILKFIAIDVDHYQRLMERLLEQNIGIQAYFSYVRSKAVKDDIGNVLDVLLQELAEER